MDIFVKLYNITTQEEVFINKHKIIWLTVAQEDLVAGFTMEGTNETVFMQFEDSDGVVNFIRGIKGEVYRVPRVAITTKEL